MTEPPAPEVVHWLSRPRLLLFVILLLASAVRGLCLGEGVWHEPFDNHYADEMFLPVEALGLWEGLTPRTLSWPASPTRLLLSFCYLVDLVCARSDVFLSPGQWSAAAFFDALAERNRQHLEDRTRLFLIGRSLAVAIGVLQVALAYWALRRWSSPAAGLLAAFLSALAPLAVAFSQFIVADMTGMVFLTWLLGLAARPADSPRRRAVVMGALLGLATASKYHHGIWLLPAALWLVLDQAETGRRGGARIADFFVLILSWAAMVLFWTPWWWTNPLLAAREGFGVLVTRFDPGQTTTTTPLERLALGWSGLGWLIVVGVGPGIAAAWSRFGWRSGPPLVLLLVWNALLAGVTLFFDRYALPMFPAALFFAALGWEALLAAARPAFRVAGWLALAAATAATGYQLAHQQRHIGGAGSYAQAHAWIVEHAQPEARLAIEPLYSRFLPRTRSQLSERLASLTGEDAYARKMATSRRSAHPAQPFRNAVLNSELWEAYWVRNELAGRRPGEGYHVTIHDTQPRFDGLLTSEAIERFVRGLDDPGQGFDILLTRQPIEGVTAEVIFPGNPGPRLYLYRRPSSKTRE